MKWAANSPHLKPIENLWATTVKQCVYHGAPQFTSKAEL